MKSGLPRTNVYVDGFNLYYGSLKRTDYKWLNLREFCRLLLPQNEINRIRYFTAPVSARPNDPDLPNRQQTYFRALRTLPEVSIHLGQFKTRINTYPLATPEKKGNKYATVVRTEEKGSDVNLATWLLMDAFKNDCDVAVVVSNDSDLTEPIRLAHVELGKLVGVVSPSRDGRLCQELSSVAGFRKRVRPGLLRASQFPDSIEDGSIRIRRPKQW